MALLINMKTRTLLVDSNYLLQRSYHGAKDIYTNSFGHIGGLYSFITTVRKLIKEHMINKVVLMWDGQNGGVARHLILDTYKANRKNKLWFDKIELSEAEIEREREKEESILKQRVRIQQYNEDLFCRQIEIQKIESDDLISAYCQRHNNNEEIFIYTNDRDFLQLLDLNITIIFANIQEPVNKLNYMMHFDHHYSNALAIKTICGDSADNIKGIEGIKEPTLLKYFPELKYKTLPVREICRLADNINKERVLQKKKPIKALENLLNGLERLRINHKLVNLREPMLNSEAIEELEQLDMPLDMTGRGSKNLIKMMNEDQFLTIYKGTFVNYVEPFYTVISHEKQILEEYKKNNKRNI